MNNAGVWKYSDVLGKQIIIHNIQTNLHNYTELKIPNNGSEDCDIFTILRILHILKKPKICYEL